MFQYIVRKSVYLYGPLLQKKTTKGITDIKVMKFKKIKLESMF